MDTTLTGRLDTQQKDEAEHSPDKRTELREIGKAVRAMRFQFDPTTKAEPECRHWVTYTLPYSNDNPR